MKKSLFALALTGALALTAAQADTVLYGSIRLGVTYGYNHDQVPGNAGYAVELGSRDTVAPVKLGKRGMDVKDEGSRVGLKGGEELGNGVKVLYQLEWGFDAAEGGNNGGGFRNRLAWIGLQGEFGTFAIGRLENPFANTINKRSEADNFNADYTSGSMAAAGAIMYGEMGSLSSFNAKMWSRVGNAVAYISPTWSGFSFNVAAIMDRGSNSDVEVGTTTIGFAEKTSGFNKSRGVDIYTINLSYVHESGFYANAGYISANLIDDAKRAYAYGLQLGFDNEQWGVNANFVRGENKGSVATGYAIYEQGNIRSINFWDAEAVNFGNWNGAGYKHTTTGWDIGGHFSFGPDYASTIRATVGQAKGDKKMTTANSVQSSYSKETNKLTTWAIGFEQKLSTRTRVWVEYANSQVKQSFNQNNIDYANTRYRNKKFTDDKVSIGIRHDF